METTTLLIIIAVALVIFGVMIYNGLIGMINAIKNNFTQIDIQLDRRSKVFDSLIATVKKAMSHELEVLTKITELRTQANSAKATGDIPGQMAAENLISNMIPKISMQMEAYPQITANTNALQLQEEIVSTENKLSFSKQAYNDSIERYETKKNSFPDSLVVKFFRSTLDKKFDYWAITEEIRSQSEQRTVQF